jgi:hypothetical protein
MVSLAALWLPIVLSAVLIFFASTVMHMFLHYHQRDYTKLPNEDAVRAAIRSGNPSPGQYIIPHAASTNEMRSAEMKQKFVEGPIAVMNIKPSGMPSIGPNLIQWFVFALAISFTAAYLASRTVAAGTDYLHVFRVVGTVAWLGYAGGQIPNAIWMGKPWSVAAKDVFDGLVYGLLTAGTFGWLWPR